MTGSTDTNGKSLKILFVNLVSYMKGLRVWGGEVIISDLRFHEALRPLILFLPLSPSSVLGLPN